MSDSQKLPQHARVGDVIGGKYRVEGVLGSGGMGVVAAATHLALERRVAVKVMQAELAQHPAAVQRLLLEAKLAAQFRSDHVCKVLDVGTLESGAPYIVMEYLEGADLATALARDGVFEIDDAVDLLLEACEALAEAHAAEIVHRDLKPENLFVTELLDGTRSLKVLDFGISKQVGVPGGNLTNPSAALGSPYYMAPEQMLSAKDVDCRADVWAVGAILFELLTGRRAFEGDTVPEICAAVMNTAPPRLAELRAEVPKALADAVERCLQKDPGARFRDIALLAAALAPFGSSSARQSVQRTERVLYAAAPASNPSLKRLERALSTGSGLTSVAGTLPAPTAVGGAGSRTDGRARRFAFLAGVAVAIGGLVWSLQRPAPRAERPAAALPPEAPVEPSPTPSPARVAPEAEPMPSAAPSAEPTPGASSARPARKARAPVAGASVTARAPSASPSVKTRAPVDAWDPATFGPRR